LNESGVPDPPVVVLLPPEPAMDRLRTELLGMGMALSGLVEGWKERKLDGDDVVVLLESLIAHLKSVCE
jgi:hypothetical protein